MRREERELEALISGAEADRVGDYARRGAYHSTASAGGLTVTAADPWSGANVTTGSSSGSSRSARCSLLMAVPIKAPTAAPVSADAAVNRATSPSVHPSHESDAHAIPAARPRPPSVSPPTRAPVPVCRFVPTESSSCSTSDRAITTTVLEPSSRTHTESAVWCSTVPVVDSEGHCISPCAVVSHRAGLP